MKAQHTPGPWKTAYRDARITEIVAAENTANIIAVCDVPEEGRKSSNAALIAAAPEMFEALSYLFSQIDNNDASITMPGVHTEWYDKARAALAKAKGV